MPDRFEQVKAEVPAEIVLTKVLGPPQRRRWLCPFHDDHHPSLTQKGGGIRCWSCGWAGDVFKFVQEHLNLSSFDALRYVADLGGVIVLERDSRDGPLNITSTKQLEEEIEREGVRLSRDIHREVRLAVAYGWRRANRAGQDGNEERAFEIVEQLTTLERSMEAAEAEELSEHGGGSEG